MLTRAFAAGGAVPVGDRRQRVWGGLLRCAAAIERSGRGYVLAVTSRQRLGFKTWRTGSRMCRAGLAAAECRRRSQGAAALRLGLAALWVGAAGGWQKGLLIRRKLAQPEAVHLLPDARTRGTGLSDLVRVAGTRWTIEACFEAAKGEVGLDQYEVRSWTGWHRHITLAMLAHAYLAVLRCTAGGEKRRARSQSRSAAAHRSGSAPPALASGLGPTA